MGGCSFYGITITRFKLFVNENTMTKNNEINQITEGVIWKQLLIFFFPILIGTFFQQLYNTVDAVIVGRFVGKEALSAVGGSTSSLINLIVGFFVGVSTGATVIISQHYGAKNKKGVSDSIGTAIALSVAGGLFLMCFCIFFAKQVLVWMDTPADTLSQSVLYMQIYALGLVPELIYNMGSGILRAMGDSRRPLYFLIASCVANVVLDLLFVIVGHMGVAGVATATMLSQYISAAMVLYVLNRRLGEYSLKRGSILFRREYLDPMIRIGLPGGVQSMTYALSNILIQSAINSFGTDTVAAWAAYAKIDGIFWMVMNALGVAITTFAGQNFGAGKKERIRKSVRICLGMAVVIAVGMSCFVVGCAAFLLSIFTKDAAVIEVGVRMIGIISPTYITYVCIEILSGVSRGCGKVVVPTIMSIVGVCGLRILWIFCAVPYHRTVEMICLSYPLTWIVTSIGFVIYYLFSDLRKKTDKSY